MRKLILMSLCMLFMAGTSAFGAYGVSGLVLDTSGNGVSGASVTINCYPSSGGSYNDTDTSGALGAYSGGWPLTNCNGEKMVVKATKGNLSGTVTWNASGVADVKNVTIRLPMVATAELHCEAEPMAVSEPYVAVPVSVNFYVQLYATPVFVNGGSTTMQYDPVTMNCTAVGPAPPFNEDFHCDIYPATGIIHVEARAPGYVEVENGENPLPFCVLMLEANDFATPGKISSVTLIQSEIEVELAGIPEMISAFPSRTEYVIGETPVRFEQLDWVGPFQETQNSAWGRVTLDIEEPAGFYYLNLSVDTDGDVTFAHVIQNMSIQSTGEPQTVSSFFDIFFDVGNYEPHDVNSLTYMYSISDVPQEQPPTSEPMTADVPGVSYQIGGEEDVTLYDLPIPSLSESICAVKMSGQLPNLGSFVNQPQGTNQCAPGAISNSLKYLQATGGVDPTADTSIGTVGGQIGTTANGTSSSWYKKKKELPYFTNLVTTRYIEAPLTLAKIQDLINELNRGQDIEMDLKGHVEVLAGIRVKCDDTVDLDLFDDNQTDSQSDPMHTSPLCTDGTNDIVDGMELERFVIECPKEPVEVLLPYLFLDTFEEWHEALSIGQVRAMKQEEGDAYMAQLQEHHVEGEPYPYDPVTNPFIESELYVHGGGGGGSYEPNDAGLVMAWGSGEGSSTSAWVLKYDDDPDYTNCIITLVVTAPQWSFITPGVQINNVSFGMGNPLTGTGPVRSWSWACGLTSTPATPIAWNTPTMITIDTSITGMTAATPTATGYANNPAFTLGNVTWLCVDENGTWIGSANNTAPGPGGFQFLWNYWHWIMVTPKTTVEKGIYKKWSQPPVVLDPNDDPPVILGWDELSNFHTMPVVADDWQCEDERPITDIHWWGSYFRYDPDTGEHISWTQPRPPALPKAFHIGIWTDVPVGADPDPDVDYSHPSLLIWENYCDNYVWDFAGYDRDPRKYPDDPAGTGGTATDPGHDELMDSCFQFTQLLSQDEWFYQKPSGDPDRPRIYWLSIAPIWDQDPYWEWGWKTRRPEWNDDAVSILTATPWWPPVVNVTKWVQGTPIMFPPPPESFSWDVAFELTTNVPAYKDKPIPGDLNGDGIVNFIDFVIFANNWLETAS